MASIARKNLFEDIPRFIVAQAGIMFAVSLVTIQTGILNGFVHSTGQLIDQSGADLWVASNKMSYLEVSPPIPLQRLLQVQDIAGVDYAGALSIRAVQWLSPKGNIATARVYGFDPDAGFFTDLKLIAGNLDSVKAPYSFIADTANLNNLELAKIGDVGTIGTLPTNLVGIARNTNSIISGAILFTSLETANAYSQVGTAVNCRIQNGIAQCFTAFENSYSPQTVAPNTIPAPPKKLSIAAPISYVLVKAKPGQDLQALRQTIQATLPDTRVVTNAEMAGLTRGFWLRRTGVGFVLGLGAAVGFVVGLVVVSQILYASVSDHIREFGTLKAMGASDWVIYRVITEQALWMAILGYLPSMGLCLGLGLWTMAAKGILILVTPAIAAGVLGITVVMCVGSALFAIQKVTNVDPAIVFKA